MQFVACQLDIAWEDKAATFDRVRSLLAASTIEPGALIALPEMFATGYSFDVEQIAEDESGPTNAFLSELATTYQATLIAGVVRPSVNSHDAARPNVGRNVAQVISPAGEAVASYTKLFPFSFAGETEHYQPGEDVTIVDIAGWRVAPLVCYDLRFPEAFRAAAAGGVDVFVVIANWPTKRVDHWETLLRARAIENQAYVIGVNRCGRDPKLDYPGRSLIIDPRGVVIAEAGDSPEVIHAAGDIDAMRQYRGKFPALTDMRLDLKPASGSDALRRS